MIRLVLRGGGDPALDGEVREEGVHLRFGHRVRVSLVVEENVPPSPVVVGVFRAKGIMADAAGAAKPVEQFRSGHGRQCTPSPATRGQVATIFPPGRQLRE